MSDITTTSSDSAVNSKALVMGLGGEGCAVIERLLSFGLPEWMKSAVIDTDSTSLENTKADFKLAASSDWTVRTGTGCGGDIIRGERALARERRNISTMLNDISLLLVTGGLGGGTCTGGIRTIASVARAAGVPTVFLLTSPFSFESLSRRRNAEDCIKELTPICEILLVMPNDLLYSTLPPDIPESAAFAKAVGETAHTLYSIASVIRSKSITGADYADFMALLKDRRAECGIGVGTATSADGLDKCTIALEKMLESPFLGGIERLSKSDAVMILATGGNNLTFAEMKRSLELASSVVPKNVEFFAGAGIADTPSDTIRMTAIAVKFIQDIPLGRHKNPMRRNASVRPQQIQESRTDVASKRPRETMGTLLQDELELTSYSRGIFDKFPQTKYRDEDLDVPTFQRKNITIDKGT